MNIYNEIMDRKLSFKMVKHPLDKKFTKTKKTCLKPDYLIKDKNFKLKLKNFFGIKIMNLKNLNFKNLFIIASK